MTLTRFHLAQVNVARGLATLDDPLMAEFVANLDEINALADRSPGFVWRFQTADGDAASFRAYEDDRMIVNFSVWETVQALNAYVYKSAHAAIMRKRRQWFAKMREMHMALWWVRAGHIPTWEEALDRLQSIQVHGPNPYAFTFQALFPPEEAPELCSASPQSSCGTPIC